MSVSLIIVPIMLYHMCHNGPERQDTRLYERIKGIQKHKINRRVLITIWALAHMWPG